MPSFFIAAPADPAKPYLSSRFLGVRPAAGGPGTGVNGGDWEMTGEEVQPTTIMRWRDQWAPGDYQRGEVVRDGDWSMVANKPTTDRAAPQPVGDPMWLLPDDPAWVVASYSGAVNSGIRVANLTRAFFIERVRIWVTDISPDATYRGFRRNNLTGEISVGSMLTGSEPGAPGFFEVAYDGDPWLLPGSDTTFFVQSQNSGSGVQTSAPYVYVDRDRDGPEVPPGAGNVTYNRDTFDVRLAKIDSLGVDQEASGLLASIIDGSTIRITDDATPTQWMEFTVIGGFTVYADHYTYACTMTNGGADGRPDKGEPATVLVDVPVQVPIDYVTLPGGLSTYPPASGVLRLGDGAEVESQDAFGPDLYVQEYEASPDWDLLAVGGVSGGSSGGGAAAVGLVEANVLRQDGISQAIATTWDPIAGMQYQFAGLDAGRVYELHVSHDAGTVGAFGAVAGGFHHRVRANGLAFDRSHEPAIPNPPAQDGNNVASSSGLSITRLSGVTDVVLTLEAEMFGGIANGTINAAGWVADLFLIQ